MWMQISLIPTTSTHGKVFMFPCSWSFYLLHMLPGQCLTQPELRITDYKHSWVFYQQQHSFKHSYQNTNGITHKIHLLQICSTTYNSLHSSDDHHMLLMPNFVNYLSARAATSALWQAPLGATQLPNAPEQGAPTAPRAKLLYSPLISLSNILCTHLKAQTDTRNLGGQTFPSAAQSLPPLTEIYPRSGQARTVAISG